MAQPQPVEITKKIRKADNTKRESHIFLKIRLQSKQSK